MSNRLKKIVTPPATCAYPWLTKPDTKFNADGIYKIELILDPEQADHKEFIESYREVLQEAGAAYKATNKKVKNFSIVDPFREQEDDEGDPTGMLIFRSKSKMKPMVVDAQTNLMGEEVWGGSQVRIQIQPAIYDNATSRSIGLTAYLNKVQVIELSSGGGGGFDVIEGGFESSVAPTKEPATTAPEVDEDF